ncbi:MAG TPA: hypothetical protein PLZ95_10620 [Bryobacteraceae bacterium]|nr:hypothetical protein [Bryobacteraceae bacterium]
MKTIVWALLICIPLALGLSACQEQDDPRIPELERQRDEAVEKSGRWRMVGILGGVGLLLFVGAGLGSSAKRKAEERNG